MISSPLRAGEPYDRPLKDRTYITSSFAEYRGSHLHNGIDFSTSHRIGAPVHAVDSGRLSRVFFDPDLYGKTVVLEHDDGRRTWYSHLSQLDSSVRSVIGGPISPGEDQKFDDGKLFSRGRRIAYSGRTGRGPAHLHLAIQTPDGSFLNPLGRFKQPIVFNPEPKIKSLKLYPLSGKTWINGKDHSVRLKERVDRTVEVWGRVGFDMTLWNEHEVRNVRSLPSSVHVFRDGKLVRELNFDRLEPAVQDTGVHRFFDRKRSNLSPTMFTLHLTPMNSQKWEGMRFREPGQNGTLKFVIETVNGNTESETFSYEVVPPPKEIEWDHQQFRPENPERVESVRDTGSSFRLAALDRGQFARKQYSPPSRDDSNEPSLTLDTDRGVNRVRVDLEIANRWEGWPQVNVRGEDVNSELPLYQVEPGHFVGIWSPELSRDGWYEFEAKLPSEEDSDSVSRRVYLQSVRPGEPGSVVSRDGLFSMFSSGSDLNGAAFVTIDTVSKKPIRSELQYVETPREVRPGWLKARTPFEVTVDLSDFDEVEQIGLYRWNYVKNEWETLSHRKGLTSSSRKARVFDPGLLALLRDERPPRVESARYQLETQSIDIKVDETGSGIDSDQLEVSTEQGSIPAYWAADESRVVVPDVSSQVRKGTLELSIVDRAGNRTKWSGSVGKE